MVDVGVVVAPPVIRYSFIPEGTLPGSVEETVKETVLFVGEVGDTVTIG